MHVHAYVHIHVTHACIHTKDTCVYIHKLHTYTRMHAVPFKKHLHKSTKQQKRRNQSTETHKTKQEGKGKPVGFVHFRFTLQGEAVGVLGGEPALYIMDIQLVDAVKKKGLGKHLVRTLEMIARQQRMMHVMLPVTVADDGAKAFFLNGMNGFIQDDLSKVVSRDGSNAAKLCESFFLHVHVFFPYISFGIRSMENECLLYASSFCL
jgi:hypothetical protein